MKRLLVLALVVFCGGVNAQTYRIAVLGSSTAAGTGASNPATTGWVALFRAHFNRNTSDGLDTVVSAYAVGGYTTYRAQPSAYTPPGGRPSPDIDRNISKALADGSNMILINYPTNDVANAYSQTETLANYQRLRDNTPGNISVFFLSPQPRTEFNSSQDAQLLEQKTLMETAFPGRVIDVFNPLRFTGSSDLNLVNDINPGYSTGDGIHVNDAGHQVIFQQVLNATSASLLPVKLKNLRAAFNIDRVDLNWETETEHNSLKFIVERSTEGRTFNTVGEVAAKGNSTTLSRYSFTDRSPLTRKSFYRLRIIDKDGSFEYSRIITASKPASGIDNIFPVPAVSELNIQLHALSPEIMEVNLTDISGRQFGHFTKALVKGNQTVSIPVSTLPRGHYTARIVRGNNISSHPFLKQ